ILLRAATAGQPGFLGKSASRWAADLRHRDAAVRRSAAFALGKCGSAAVPEVPKLVRSLKDPNARVREAAAFALGEIGPTAWDETIPALINLLANDSEALIRRSAAFALGSLGRHTPPSSTESIQAIRTALEKSLGDSEPSVRQNAARALGRLGPQRAL